jgi:hypothetical protein
MRHEWQDNPRDDIGFGIPKESTLSVASVRVAANKAVRIAVLLLGEKVADEVIEEQARDLMGMKSEAMDATLARFAETQELYEAADDSEEKAAESIQEKKEEEAKEDKKASEVVAEDEKKDDEKKDDAKEAAEDERKDEDKKEASEALVKESGGVKPATDVPEPAVGDEDKKASEMTADEKFEAAVQARVAELEAEKQESLTAAIEAEAQKRLADDDSDDDDDDEDSIDASTKEPVQAADEDEKKDDEKKEASDDETKAVVAEDEKKDDDEKKEASEDESKAVVAEDEKKDSEKKEASVPNKGANEMDIELTSSMDDALEPDAVADAQLASIFDDDEAILAAELEKEQAAGGSTVASEKAGIKTLGGQPRVASQSGAEGDISGIWQTAPDVSEVFK